MITLHHISTSFFPLGKRCFPLVYQVSRFRSKIACAASVSVWFRSKKRPWKGIFGFDRARNETRTPPRPFTCATFRAVFDFVPYSLLLNRTETLATQAGSKTERSVTTELLSLCSCCYFKMHLTETSLTTEAFNYHKYV